MRASGTVSVIMPVYRGEAFVAAAIDSVLAQTYRLFELIIVNDGSPDASDEVISGLLPHPQIRYVKQANAGVAAARNTGLANATGDYIALLDQDDLWLPTKLERQIAYLDAHPDVGLVHSSVECIDAAGKTCTCIGAISVYPFEGFCAGGLLRGNGIAPLTVMMRRTCIDDVGEFDQRFAPADDWELWVRIARRHAFGFMDETTARYRVHQGNVSKDDLKMQRAVLSIVESICSRFPDVPKSISDQELALARGSACSRVAEALERRGSVREARDYWKQAYRLCGDMDALLALLGMRAGRRSRVQNTLRASPRFQRFLTWYLYRVAMWFLRRSDAQAKNG